MLQLSNTPRPTVSILISVYNKKRFEIDRAINSVLNQDFADFEIIIIDDGSNLDVGKQLLEHAFKHEDKITFLRHKNIGQAMSLNKAITISRSPFIGFLDSDDEYKPNHISACLSYMNDDCDLIASTTENIVDNEAALYVPDKYDVTKNIHIDECILLGSLFGKREVFLNTGFKDMYSLDSELFERASKVYKTKKVDLRTYKYYLGTEDSITTRLKKAEDNL